MAKASKFPVGSEVRFKGYAEDTAEADQLLEEGEVYKVIEVNDKEKSAAVEIPNPDFNPKKKVTEENSETLIVDVFFDEIELADEDGDDEEEAPKSKGKAKADTKSKAKSKAKDEDEDEDDEGTDSDDDDGDDDDADDVDEEEEAPKAKKGAAKGKTETKAKPAAKGKEKTATKGKDKAKTKTESKKSKDDEEEADKYGDLSEDQEDKEILSLIEDADDLVELAKEVVEENASSEYRLGGILFHLRRDKAYEKLDKRYAAKGSFGVPSGFQVFINEELGLDYRKAMYLVDIYYKFSKYGIDASKVAEIGWTKASKIAAVMTEDNADDLVELAEGSSVTELSESIKETYVDASENKGGKETRRKVQFKFKLFEDQASAVEEILNAAAESLSMKPDDVFEHIVTEWAAENGVSVKAGKKASKDKAEAKSSDKASSKPKARK
jgi:hypothetical protein